jgi:hypothetical protein
MERYKTRNHLVRYKRTLGRFTSTSLLVTGHRQTGAVQMASVRLPHHEFIKSAARYIVPCVHTCKVDGKHFKQCGFWAAKCSAGCNPDDGTTSRRAPAAATQLAWTQPTLNKVKRCSLCDGKPSCR